MKEIGIKNKVSCKLLWRSEEGRTIIRLQKCCFLGKFNMCHSSFYSVEAVKAGSSFFSPLKFEKTQLTGTNYI